MLYEEVVDGEADAQEIQLLGVVQHALGVFFDEVVAAWADLLGGVLEGCLLDDGLAAWQG